MLRDMLRMNLQLGFFELHSTLQLIRRYNLLPDVISYFALNLMDLTQEGMFPVSRGYTCVVSIFILFCNEVYLWAQQLQTKKYACHHTLFPLY